MHQPVELTDILPDGPFWSRLAFDELLAGQLALALVRAQLRRPGREPQCRRRSSAQQGHRCAALRADGLAARGRGRDRRRSATAGADAAAAAGRRRLRQDRGRAARGRGRRRSRQAGGADGADRNSGAPAYQDDRAAGRARRPARCDPHRPREGQGAARTAGAPRSRRDRSAGRHPCADPGRRRFQDRWRWPSSTSSTVLACANGSR